jgi:hypothetical protein
MAIGKGSEHLADNPNGHVEAERPQTSNPIVDKERKASTDAGANVNE